MPRVLFLKALVAGYTRRAPGRGGTVVVRPYSASRRPAGPQPELFAPAQGHYTGWTLGGPERSRLMELFPPAYPDIRAHHVTHQFPAADPPAPPARVPMQVVGIADDGAGVQALVLAVDGDTRRPDGGTYHMTWSVAPGREAAEANDVVGRGWTPVGPIAVDLAPAVLRRGAAPARAEP